MTLKSWHPLLLLAAAGFAATAYSQKPETPQTATASQSTTSSTYTLNVVVTDTKGHPFAGTAVADFSLEDNGRSVPLLAVRPVDSRVSPGKVLIVIDAVNATYTQVAFEREEIEKYLSHTGGTLPQPTSLVLVTDTSLEATPGYTTDAKVLSETLRKKNVGLRDLRQNSGFYGAEERLDISLKALDRVLGTAAAVPGHKLVLWISPGWPLLSGPGIQFANHEQERIFQQVQYFARAIHAADVTLYSLNPIGAAENLSRTDHYEEFLNGARKPSQVQLGNLGLQVLAVQSGGLALNGNNSITALLQQCIADTGAAYTLSFVPPPAEPGNPFQQLHVHLADIRLKARTAQGLYLTPLP